MFGWPIAATAPSAMESTETIMMICCHSWMASGNGPRIPRKTIPIAATFGAVENSAVMGVGAPSYTSGVHIWNGTAEILKMRPAMKNTIPNIRPMFTPDCCTTIAICVNIVVPLKP